MKISELTLEQKKACIAHIIIMLTNREEEFICHCFSTYVDTKTDIRVDRHNTSENYMHIIFPELYKELKSLVDDVVGIDDDLKYNANNTRMGDVFEENYKCPIWFHDEIDERVHFLNDLNETLK